VGTSAERADQGVVGWGGALPHPTPRAKRGVRKVGRAVDVLVGSAAAPEDLDFAETAGRAVRLYVRQVTRALGIAGECSSVDVGPPVGAYLALDGRLASHPEQDVALLWNEEDGWAMAVETGGGEDPVVVARRGGEPLPPPHAVAHWATGLLHGSGQRQAHRTGHDLVA
jgi:uncharacterized protein DUF6292